MIYSKLELNATIQDKSADLIFVREQNKPAQFVEPNKLYSKHDLWYHNQANDVKSQKGKFGSFGHVVKIPSRAVI